MARGTLTVLEIARAGLVGALVAADDTDGHKFLNDGRTFLLVLNTAVACTLTFQTPGTVDGLAIAERTVVIAIHATDHVLIGPFPPGDYNQSNGMVFVDVDTETTVTLAAVRLPV